KITLVFIKISAAKKSLVFCSCVMPRRHKICTEPQSFFQKHPKLHFFVTHHIWIWSSASFVLVYHIHCHRIFVFFLRVNGKEWHIKRGTNSHRITSLL